MCASAAEERIHQAIVDQEHLKILSTAYWVSAGRDDAEADNEHFDGKTTE